MILPPTLPATFASTVTFLIQLLNQYFIINQHIQTIAIYYDNSTSREFVNSIYEQVSAFNKPMFVISTYQIPQITTNGHEALHLFLWKDSKTINIATELWFVKIPLIRNAKTVFFVFEEPQRFIEMDTISESLIPTSSSSTFLIFEDIDTNKPDMIVYRLFRETFRWSDENPLQRNLNGTLLFKSERVNMQGTNTSVLLVLRPPNVVQLKEKGSSGKHLPKFGGRDGRMANFLATFFNATFHYVTQATLAVLVVQNDGKMNSTQYVPLNAVQDNDSFVVDDEVKPMVLNVSSDILMNSRMCCDITTNYINFYPHEFDSYIVLVPSSNATPYLRRLFHPVTGYFLIIAIFLFSSLWAVYKYILYKNDKIDYDGIVVEVLGILLLTKEAKAINFISERILLTFILFFATVMSIIEAGVIYDEMIKEVDAVEINNLKELGRTNYPILLTADAKVLMEFGKVAAELQKKFVLSDTNEITYQILSKNTSQAYILRRSRAESFLKRYSMEKDGKTIFHIVNEPLLPSLTSYYARDTFPFADDFNALVQRTIENGIFQHFDRISKYNIYFEDNYRKEVDDDLTNQEKTISMTEVMSTLFIFSLGMGMSCVVFVLEIIWFKIEPRVKEWIEVRKKINLIRTIQEQNQGFIKEPLFEFVE